jgi:hypothetical protein
MLRIAADYERLGERAVVEGKRLHEDGQIERREPEIPDFAERAGPDEATGVKIAQCALIARTSLPHGDSALPLSRLTNQ